MAEQLKSSRPAGMARCGGLVWILVVCFGTTVAGEGTPVPPPGPPPAALEPEKPRPEGASKAEPVRPPVSAQQVLPPSPLQPGLRSPGEVPPLGAPGSERFLEPVRPLLPMEPTVKDQTHPMYLLDLARVQMQYRAHERALPLLETALETAKDPVVLVNILQQLGTLYEDLQNWEKAIGALERMVSLDNHGMRKANALFKLADLYARLGKLEKTESILANLAKGEQNRERLKADPGLVQASSNSTRRAMARLLRLWQSQEGMLDKVIAAAEAAVAADPKNEEMLERLAEIYTNVASRRDTAKAVAVYEKLAPLRPKDPSIQNWLASLYQQNKEPEKAIKVFQKMMEAETGVARRQYAFQVAQQMLSLGQKQEAVAFVEANLLKEATDPTQLSLASVFFENAGMHKESVAALEKCIELAQNPTLKSNFRLRLAETLRRNKDYPGAEKQIREVLGQAELPAAIKDRANQALLGLAREQAPREGAEPKTTN